MEVDRCGRITLLEFLSKTPTNTTSGNLHIQSQRDQMTPPPTPSSLSPSPYCLYIYVSVNPLSPQLCNNYTQV